MSTLRLAFLEMKALFSSRLMRIAMTVVCLIPLLYGVLYLWAFWDPYSMLDDLPVAVVNNDKPARVDGVTVHVGDDLVDKLKETGTLKWTVVSEKQAEDGLEDGTYYLALEIPSNLSSDVADADSDSATSTNLTLASNESSNLLATQLGASVVREVRSSLSSLLAQRYLKKIFVSIGDIHGAVAKGASKVSLLSSGIKTVDSGAATLASGAASATSGSKSLESGLNELSDGAGTLKSGAAKLSSGAGTLASGAASASDGAKTLAGSTRKLGSATSSLSSGLATLDTSSGTLKSASADVASGASQVATGAATAATSTQTAATSSGTLAAGASQVYQALQAYLAGNPDAAKSAYFSAALSGSKQVADGLDTLHGGLSSAVTSMNTLSVGAAKVSSGASSVSDGMAQLSTGVSSAASGASKLSSGAASLSSGASRLANGVSAVGSGAKTLAAGTKSLAGGTSDLAAGADSASSGSTELTLGLEQLTDGAVKLHTGTTKLANGGSKLSKALTKGAKDIPDYTSAQRATRAAAMGDAVKLTNVKKHHVPNYGTGFTPYFVPLALWVGALITSLLMRPLSGRALASPLSERKIVLAGLWPALIVGAVQSLIMLLVLQLALGLDPVNAVATYLFTLLTAVAFAAIMQLLSAVFGTPGKFIAIVLLMLQLTSAAGTFPLELVPNFFRVINPFLPMTYVVAGLRQCISGGDISRLLLNAGVLLAFALGSIVLTTLTARRQRVWTMDRLKPELAL